jgi:signal transduction histidine kinase
MTRVLAHEMMNSLTPIASLSESLEALAELTEGIERLMSATLQQRGVTYRSRVTPLGLGVTGDRQLLEQALINLLRNALDAVVGTAQPLIEVDCRAKSGSVEITVADNGPGMDAEERDRIFVPFYTTRVGGSGIGLSLARYVAIAHGGQLEVEPAVPRGTRFILRLPA